MKEKRDGKVKKVKFMGKSTKFFIKTIENTRNEVKNLSEEEIFQVTGFWPRKSHKRFNGRIGSIAMGRED